MFYDPREDLKPDPLTHNPVNALVAPRPIGWIGTSAADGNVNLAPFSYFNVFAADPPSVAFGPSSKDAEGTPKDSLANVREVPEFTVSIVSRKLADQMNQTSADYERGVSEFEQTGLTTAGSRLVTHHMSVKHRPCWNVGSLTFTRCHGAAAASSLTWWSARLSAFTLTMA